MRFFILLPLGILLAIASAQAAVNDVLPADYFPLATGTSTIAVYAFDRQSQGPYSKGAKLIDGNLDTQIAVLRASHFIMVADMPVSLITALPWSQNSVDPTPLAGAIGKEANGFGDLRLGATGWLLANRESGEYFGVSGLLFLPTGGYNSRQVLNVGENTDYAGGQKLTQKPSYALTSYLRYRASQNWQFHLGAQFNSGGETQINGIDQNNPPDNNRAMLGTTYQTDDKLNQWILRVARDTSVKNGFMTTSEVMLRYLRMFCEFGYRACYSTNSRCSSMFLAMMPVALTALVR